MNYVVCLKHGNKYSSEYVNKLYRMVKRNLTVEFEFVCFTESRKHIDPEIRVEPLPPTDTPGWWFKPYFFDLMALIGCSFQSIRYCLNLLFKLFKTPSFGNFSSKI